MHLKQRMCETLFSPNAWLRRQEVCPQTTRQISNFIFVSWPHCPIYKIPGKAPGTLATAWHNGKSKRGRQRRHSFTWTACSCKLLLHCCSASRSNYLFFVSTCHAAQRTICQPAHWVTVGVSEAMRLYSCTWRLWIETAPTFNAVHFPH